MTQAKHIHPLILTLKAGTAYFAMVFAIGFVLGTIRVLWLAPYLGERMAELSEMPWMLLASVLSARWVTGKFALPALALQRLAVGMLALAWMLTFEFTLVLGLRGLSLNEYFASRDAVAGSIYLAMLGLFTLMPWLLSLPRHKSHHQ